MAPRYGGIFAYALWREQTVDKPLGIALTMPSERRRALRWARTILQEVGSDPGVPTDLAADVANVLAAFPDDRAVATCFLELDEDRLQRNLAAIEAAQEVLGRARRCLDLSERTRSSVVATDRHFPQVWEMSKAPWPLSPREWVEFYLLRDLSFETMRQELLQLGFTDIDMVCVRLGRSETAAGGGREFATSGEADCR